MVAQVTLCLLTYNRFDYAKTTICSALDNIKTSHPLAVHIADDGSGKEYQEELRKVVGGYDGLTGICITDSQRGGYGKNVNLATQVMHSHSRYIVMIEDDWKLAEKLDLDPLLDTLDTAPTIGCIRMGYIGFTQELRGRLERWYGQTYLVFDPTSPEPHVFAGHPRVEAVAWQREVGLWDEGLLPGLTEFKIAHREAARQRVAWPLDLVRPNGSLWHHIGTERAY